MEKGREITAIHSLPAKDPGFKSQILYSLCNGDLYLLDAGVHFTIGVETRPSKLKTYERPCDITAVLIHNSPEKKNVYIAAFSLIGKVSK